MSLMPRSRLMLLSMRSPSVAAASGATLGDLIESSIKRDLGIKDMGALLPGHGGLMDRLDSLVVVAPIAWALLMWFVPLG